MLKRTFIFMVSGMMLCGTAIASSDEQAAITGRFDDQQREWFILSQENDSNASFVEVGDQLRIDITGFAQPDSWDARDALAMSFIIEQETLVEAEVVHMISGTAMPPVYTSNGGEIDVSLTHFEQNGPLIHMAGQIEGILVLQEELDAEPNPNEEVSVDVQFDIEARRVKF